MHQEKQMRQERKEMERRRNQKAAEMIKQAERAKAELSHRLVSTKILITIYSPVRLP